jgi:hypothetical protein
MNYFITGITGFLEPHLANLLIKNGNTVYALRSWKSVYIDCDELQDV